MSIGAHYTYAEVPYNAWWESYYGSFSERDDLGGTRNNFDRLVHFAYGLLLAYPIREVYLRIAGVRGLLGLCLPSQFYHGYLNDL